MQKVSFYETIDPATLSQEALTAFRQKLYAIHCQIFDGVDTAQFEKKVFDVNAKWSKICIFKNIKGKAVGYYALHAYEKIINSENIVIFRAETGILRDYRKQGNISSFFFKEIIKYKALHPFQKSYLFCTLVHPSSYHLLSKFFPRYYPNIKYATPPDILERMQQMADAFHEVQLPNVDPSIRQVGWITRQTAEEQNKWARSREPDTRFFLKKNPDYHKGQGLVTLVPLDLNNILLGSIIFSYNLGKNLIYGIVKKRIMTRK